MKIRNYVLQNYGTRATKAEFKSPWYFIEALSAIYVKHGITPWNPQAHLALAGAVGVNWKSYCLDDGRVAAGESALISLIDAGVEQADKRAWFPFPAPVDRQRPDGFKAPRRAVQSLLQVLHRHAARGQGAAPATPTVRQPVGEEGSADRQTAAQRRRRGGQAVALPEDVATGLLKAVYGGEHDIDPLIGQ
jgi:hypothetical protein